MHRIRPRELQVAARVTEALVYAAGAAGVIAGGLLFRDDHIGFAIFVWALTFVAGAGLRLLAAGARALAQLLVTVERLAEEVADLRGPAPPREPPRDRDQPPDPYRRWGGWH